MRYTLNLLGASTILSPSLLHKKERRKGKKRENLSQESQESINSLQENQGNVKPDRPTDSDKLNNSTQMRACVPKSSEPNDVTSTLQEEGKKERKKKIAGYNIPERSDQF